MDQTDHRHLAETLATRALDITPQDPEVLAQIAVVHALLATGPTDLAPVTVLGRAERPVTWQGWVLTLLILGTILGVVALVTR